jgi:hypothetical protein
MSAAFMRKLLVQRTVVQRTVAGSFIGNGVAAQLQAAVAGATATLTARWTCAGILVRAACTTAGTRPDAIGLAAAHNRPGWRRLLHCSASRSARTRRGPDEAAVAPPFPDVPERGAVHGAFRGGCRRG